MHALQNVHEVSISDIVPEEAPLPNQEQPYAGLALVRDPQTVFGMHCLAGHPLYVMQKKDDLHAGQGIHRLVTSSCQEACHEDSQEPSFQYKIQVKQVIFYGRPKGKPG